MNRHGAISEWAGQANIHPGGVAALIVCLLFLFMVKRDKAIYPLILLLIAIPSAQRFILLDLDFSFIRLAIFAGFARVIFRKEYVGFKFELPDKLMLCWMVWSILAFTFLVGELSGAVTRIGYMVEVVGAYFLARLFVRSLGNIVKLVNLIGIASIPMLILFSIERVTGRNLFAEFGGVPDFTLVRDGRLRCQGPFSHPIMAGVFWANLLPWLAAMWVTKLIPKPRIAIYALCTIGIIANTASSTPVMAVIFGAIGFAFYFIRQYMSVVRWGILGSLIILHFVMEAPVWHLMARLNVVGGSTGWHRFYLIDKAVEHFWDWWLVGVRSTSYWGAGLGDVTNQFILEGVRGGILGVILYMCLFFSIFWIIGKGMKASKMRSMLFVLWASGTVVFVNFISFTAVSYFGQMNAALSIFLGISVSLAVESINLKKKKRQICQESSSVISNA